MLDLEPIKARIESNYEQQQTWLDFKDAAYKDLSVLTTEVDALQIECLRNRAMALCFLEVIGHVRGFIIDDKPRRAEALMNLALKCYWGQKSWDELETWLQNPNYQEIDNA